MLLISPGKIYHYVETRYFKSFEVDNIELKTYNDLVPIIEKWCRENCKNDFNVVTCSDHKRYDKSIEYTIGVNFETESDALLFKLVWG